LQRRVEEAKRQFEAIQNLTLQKQQAVTTLMNLQLAGFSEKEIAEWIGLVTTWNKSGIGGAGFGQGNGSSANGKLDDKLIGIGH
jgi:hypothetical protein